MESVFEVLNTAAVRALVGADPLRIYDFDSAPDEPQTPYIVWSLVVNVAHDHLSGAPRGDTDTVQVDCYAGPDEESGRAQARALRLAVRDAFDAAGFINHAVTMGRERDTKLFRSTIEAECIFRR